MKDITFRNSMKYGDLTTKLSLLILGLGNFRGRQIIKGILYIALEAAFIIFMIIISGFTQGLIEGITNGIEQNNYSDFDDDHYNYKYDSFYNF